MTLAKINPRKIFSDGYSLKINPTKFSEMVIHKNKSKNIR